MTKLDTNRTDLVHLVQHVALNQSGWWEQALERLVLACAYKLGPTSRDRLCGAVQESSGVNVTSDRLTDTLARLLEAGSLVEHHESVRVSETVREELKAYEAKTIEGEKRVHLKFIEMAKEHNLAERTDELWPILEREVILPIVRYMGAQLYELLTLTDPDARTDLSAHIDGMDERYGEGIRDFFFEFIDPTDDDIRRFVLRRLNAQYATDAAALPASALDRLAQRPVIPSRVRLIVDTNFLFSIMGLHNNPGNEEANKLLQLVSEVSSRVNLKLYVLPITVDETRTVLGDVTRRLSRFRGQPNLAEAAKYTNSLGLAERYLEAASRSSTNLSPADFFGPYESDLLPVLRNKNVELYNTSLDELRTDQDVIDDIHELSERQQRFRRRGEKSYETNLHDMVLWHFARRERRVSQTSPLEVSIWIVTLDYSLISFEKYKLRRRGVQIPICLEPASIIQLFQFWVPSSTELDEALVGSLRQPLLFLNFGQESEQVTLRILGQLSRFDGAGDLPPEVALEILTNEALRQRISASQSDRETDEQIVGEELLEMINQLTVDRDEARQYGSERLNDLTTLSEAASREKSLREQAEERLRKSYEIQQLADRQMKELIDYRAARDVRVAELERQNSDLEQSLENIRQAETQKKLRQQLLIRSLLLFLTSLATLVGGSIALSTQIATPLAWTTCGGLSSLALFVGLEIIMRNANLAESKTYSMIRWLKRSALTFLFAVAASLSAAWLYDWL